MTKKEILKWRLSKLPSSEEVLALVKDGVITKEEAREILFSTESEDTRDEKSLKEEIKFLKNLVEKLSNSQTTRIIEVIKEVEVPYYKRPWYRPYYQWSTSGGFGNDNMLLCANDATNFSAKASNALAVGNLSSLASGGLNAVATECSFSNLKTF